MFFNSHRSRIARSIVGVIAAGFIQVGFSAPAAVAAPLAAPTITSSTVTATTMTVNLQTAGFAATSWRYIVNRRQVSGCATSVTDGAVQTTASLQGSITITGLTEGCYYTVKVAGFNGSIGAYAAVEKLVNGYLNGLKIYHKSETASGDGFTRTPFTSGTCATGVITTLNQNWSDGGPSGCGSNDFTSYVVGYIKAPHTGSVTFRSTNDDGLQLNIQGQRVFLNSISGTSPSGSINMVQDEIYRIEIWFHEIGGAAYFSIDWEYTGRTRISVPTENLATDPSVFFGTCPIGLDPRCAAGSALEIKRATGTNMDGHYWININGTPTLVFCIMNSSQGGGGWMLAMRGKNASSTFKYDSALWTNSTLLNESYPQRFSASDTIDTYRNTDAKYAPFSNLPGNQVMVLYPEVDNKAGGAFGTNGSANASGVNSVKYGFAWHETFTTGTPWTAYNSTTKWGGNSWNIAHTGGPTNTPACVTTPKTLSNLFNESSRCAFRRVSSNYVSTESPYSAVGDNVFFSQTNIRFFGVNYANANTSFFSKARIGFGWNENGPGNEDSNDGNGGIGLSSSGSTSMAAGTFNGCCSATVNAADANTAGQTGLSGGDNTTKQLGFELYVRNSVELPVSGNSVFQVTKGRTNSLVAARGYFTSGNSGTTTFKLSSIRDGFTIDPSTGVITVSEALPVGSYSTKVTVGDGNSASGAKDVTINVLTDSSETDSALSFNGSNQFVSNVGTFSTPGDFTYEFWVKPNNNCSQQNGFNKPVSTTNVWISCWGGMWYFSYMKADNSTPNFELSQKVVANDWAHFAIVRTNSGSTGETYIYYNNRQINLYNSGWVASVPITSFKGEFGNIRIGGSGTANEYFNGLVDEVKVWQKSRTLSDIWAGAHLQQSSYEDLLVLNYDFNEASGNAISRGQRGDYQITLGTVQRTPVASATPVGPYTVVTVPRTLINSIGGWRAPESITAITALVLGGGGGGGGGLQGGGGGAGGFLESTVLIDPTSVYEFKVGVGGAGYLDYANRATTPSNGQDSVAFGLTAKGGGYGGTEYVSPNNHVPPSSGGSGGGGTWGNTSANYLGAAGTSGQGFKGGNTPSIVGVGGGGGGAGGEGLNGSASKGGDGGAGKLSIITGTFLAGGGGGALRDSSAGGIGGTGGGGGAATVRNAAVDATGGPQSGAANTGSGGGGGIRTTSNTDGFGGNGGSGVIVIRYITAFKPTFTQPTNAFLNVGMTETFSVNVAQDSQTAQLTRTFRWESSTTGSGGPFTLIKQGTGAANASFSWVPTDTSTSGSNFLYRVIVTDSDTAGLFIVDTSTAVFATINRALVLNAKSTLSKTVNISKVETFTVTLGTPTYRYAFTNNNPLITLDTSTVGSPRIRMADTITVGTYYETFTVIDSVSATIVQPLTIVVSPPPSFSANGVQVDSGTVLYLDAGNIQSNTGTGSTWKDISGRGLTATFPPSPAPAMNGVTSGNLACSAPTYTPANLGTLEFNGAQCGYVPNVGLLKVYTYEVWVKRSAEMTNYSAVIANPWSGATGQQLAISLHWMANGTIQAGIFDGTSWGAVVNSPVINIGIWTHVAVTFNGSTLNMTLNGDLAGKISADRSLTWVDAKNDTGILIGKRFDYNTDYFKGSVGSVRIYNRVLTDAELLQNYNATKGRFLNTQNKQGLSGKYGTTVNETYTVTAGSETITAVFTSSAVAGLKWDTSTVRSMGVQLQDSLTAGTYNDTITVTDIYGSSTRIVLTITVAKADTITVTMDTPTVTTFNDAPITVYPKPIIRGLVSSDTATVTTKFLSTNYPLSATPPTNSDTYTVGATDLTMLVGSLNNYLGVVVESSTARINKARQAPLMVSTYTGFIGSSFTITVLGGSGGGAISETFTGLSTAPNCQINNQVLTSSATSTSYCQLQITKAESQNHFSESITALIYFIEFVFSQPTQSVGGGSGIGLTGQNDVRTDSEQAPTFSSLSVSSGTVGSSLTINGAGFFYADPTKVEIKFSRSAIATTYTLVSNSVIEVTVPVGATTSRIVITTPRGIAATSTFTVVP
jgi:Concanavalin A-like lectin/glucanases superfamily